MRRREFLGLGAGALTGGTAVADGRWPQAAGTDGTWQARGGRFPRRWSVATGENVLWRTPLPETGQSGIAIWDDRLFLTTMQPLPDAGASKDGGDIVGYCLDARTGKILWSVALPATEPSPYAYGFSDASSPTPVTDGRSVWFVNSSGAMARCDAATGAVQWQRRFTPTTGRPFNKQFEPILHRGTLLHVEPRDPGDPKREADPWNYLRGIEAATGRTLWGSDDALTHYNAPVLGRTANGDAAVLIGRGGYHEVPETPIGLSLVSVAPGREGKTLWRFETTGKALYTMHWDARYAYWIDQDRAVHRVIDARTGRLLREQPLGTASVWHRYDAAAGRLVAEENVDFAARGIKVFPAWFTNIVVGGWHWFLCSTDAEQSYGPAHSVGRVHIATGRTEYCELPTAPGIWGTAQSASTVNSRGIDVASDPRSRRDGWFWCFLGTPTAAGGTIFWTTMAGVTYAIDGRAKVLDARALLGVNDLGPIGQSWSLNSVSVAGDRLYHRSMKEAVCLGRM